MTTNGDRRTSRAPRHAAPASEVGTIRAGQGAKVTTRKNAAEAADRARHNAEERYYRRHPEARGSAIGPERSKRNVLALVAAAILGLAVLFFVVRCATAVLTPGPAEIAEQMAEQQGGAEESQADPQTARVDVGDALSYQGQAYSLAMQESGRYGVVRLASDGSSTTLFELEGTPVALLRYGSTLLVPENRDGGWDVACYVIAGHSSATYVVGSDGTMVTGTGDIASVELDGSTLRVTDGSGSTTEVTVA